MSAAANAKETSYVLDIPAAKADVSLKALANATGRSLLFDYRKVQNTDTNALHGRYTLKEALETLLLDTGLVSKITSGGVITIEPAPSISAEAGEPADGHTKKSLLAKLLSRSGPRKADEGKNSAFTIEEILVTARKVRENLQNTPVSVSAFTGDKLEYRQVFTSQDLDKVVPNLQFATNAPLSGNNSASQIFIRGIGQTDPTAGVDPGVGLYIDDIYMGQSVGGALDFLDVESVQVLRGPQGTLFGRNTIGGAILLQTPEPGDELDARLRASFGSDAFRKVLFSADAPISKTLKTRFSFGLHKRRGYVTRAVDGLDLGDDNTYSTTVKALWTPTDMLAITLKGDFTKEDEHGTPLVFAAINEDAALPRSVSFQAGCPGMTSINDSVPMIDDPRCANDYWNAGPYVANGTYPLGSKLENWGVALIGDWAVSDRLTLKSMTSYRSLSWSGHRDADNTPFTILQTDYDSDGDQFSQEFQAIYRDDRLTGVMGLFYYQESISDKLRVTLASPVGLPATADSNNNEVRNDNWAVFTQWTADLTNRFSVSAGIRYTSEWKGSKPDQFSYDNPGVLYVPNIWFRRKFDAVTGSASAQFRWSNRLMTYLSWSQGFKSGGFNSRFNAVVPAGAPPSFGEEKAETIELGFKSDPTDTLRFNGAFFTTDYNNLQFTYRIGFAPFLFNAGEASIKGFELEFQYVPVPNLSIEGGLGYLDDRIKSVSDIPGATTAVTTHSALPYTPSWQGNLAIAYSVHDIKGLVLTPRVDLSYTGPQFFDSGNTPEISQTRGVTLVNASVAVDILPGDASLTFGIRNLTDEIYPIAGNSSLTTGAGYAEIAYSRPREWFLSLSKDF